MEKKGSKRKACPSCEVDVQEMLNVSKKTTILFIENLLPFSNIKNQHLITFYNELSNEFEKESLNPLKLTTACLELYNDFKTYFCNYFNRMKGLKISLICHKWQFSSSINPFIFISTSFISQDFELIEFPIALIEMNEHFTTNLINDTILKDLQGKVSFITSNTKFNQEISDFLTFLTTENSLDKNFLYCFPSFLNECISKFIFEIKEQDEDEAEDEEQTRTNAYSNHFCNDITIGIQLILNPILKLFQLKFNELLSVIDESTTNINVEFKQKLKKLLEFIKNNNSNKMIFQQIEQILKLKIEILQQQEIPNLVNEKYWQLIEFILEFIKRFHEIIIECLNIQYPTIHMILKWIKILIVHTTTLEKNLQLKYNLIISNNTNLIKNIAIILEKLLKYHDDIIHNNFDLILASYLHPSTKRYLQDGNLNQINSYVADKAKLTGIRTSNNAINNPTNFDNLDDMIMKVFNCSGSGSKECYRYETSSNNEIKYDKSSRYISLETGPNLLKYWQSNIDKYPTLSRISRQVLSIQLSTIRQTNNLFQEQISLIRSIKDNGEMLQAIYVLHVLSKQYNLYLFDPKDLDSQIEEFRFGGSTNTTEEDDEEMDLESDYGLNQDLESIQSESSIEIERDSNKRARKL
ncbi:hypothetical protein CAAN3_10S04368 [[Candida] anglica]